MNHSDQTPLETMKNQLKELANKPFEAKYLIPALWVETGKQLADGMPPKEIHPGQFYLSHIDAIEKNCIENIDPLKSLNQQIPGGDGGKWIETEVIYNLFVRLTTAYDHDGDGKLGGADSDLTLNADGLRESGTFLKAIAMLGYIKALGATTIHLLPVTAIGRDGNKGELGSPYAIKDPYKLEPSQADTLLDMSVEDQFKAFVQACHMLGIRVIVEFIFRTASKDSDWIKQNPDWFYWIKESVEDRSPQEKDLVKAAAGYGNPVFAEEELRVINKKIFEGDFNELPSPSQSYKDFFLPSPSTENVFLNNKGQIRAKTGCPQTGVDESVRIPGAFADWPPDDNQPPWGDVTYLRMYLDQDPNNPEFNYIAYNTIRMYDNRFANEQMANTPLWETLIDLIPSYQHKYGIDGVMVDMGHAVPVSLMQKIIDRARSEDPDFAFLSENFEIKEDSVQAGYNAVVGYAWWVEYSRDGMYNLLNHVGNEGVPLSFFGAVENHNTPRAAGRDGGEKYSAYAFLVNTFLPRSIPFIHSGQEIGETVPVNTGLDFSDEALKKLQGRKLALFDICAYNWDGEHKLLKFYQQVLRLRREFADVADEISTDAFCMVQTGKSDVIAFIRRFQGKHIMVLFNRDLESSHKGQIGLEWCLDSKVDYLHNHLADVGVHKGFAIEEQKMNYKLQPGECTFFAW